MKLSLFQQEQQQDKDLLGEVDNFHSKLVQIHEANPSPANAKAVKASGMLADTLREIIEPAPGPSPSF